MMDKKYVELKEHRAIMCLPENAVSVKVIATVFEDGDLQDVSAVYDMNAIREMFRKADEGYIDDDDRFVLTEKGRAFLEELGRQNE